METSRLALFDPVPPTVPEHLYRVWPEVPPEDDPVILDALHGGMRSVFGKYVKALETAACEYFGTRYAVAVNSGTAALHAAYVGAGLLPGDEVIVPAHSFIASGSAAAWAGAKAVYGDIRPDTYELDWSRLDRLVTKQTRMVAPVAIHGLPPDMDACNEFASRHNLTVVEDAAQGAGSKFNGKRVGSFGRAAAISLSGPKPWTAGEGGLVLCDDHEVHKAVRLLACHGEERPRPLKPGEQRSYHHRWLGQNYRMHDVVAAIALCQLQRLDRYIERARANAALLYDGLAAIPGVTPPVVPPGRESTNAYFRVMLDPTPYGYANNPREFRNKIYNALAAEGVKITIYQENPLPASPLERRGRHIVYSPGIKDGPLEPWDPSLYRVASHVLASSVVLGEARYMLHIQSPEVMHLTVLAFVRVFNSIERVLSGPDWPIPIVPPIPKADFSPR